MKTTSKVLMDPGTYYIGDLCYVMSDVWDDVCATLFQHAEKGCVDEGGFRLPNNQNIEFVSFNTAWGDGTYFDKEGRSYAVDSGGIGCISVDHVNMGDLDAQPYLGNIITFDKPFLCERVDGTIYFGRIAIETDPELVDEEDEYEV